MAVLKTVSEYKDSVAAILSGMNLNIVSDLNGSLERAARTLVQKADIPEASGIQNIVLYSGVFDYACDTTIFGTAITDIRPQGISRPAWDTTTKTYGQQFDRLKNYYPSGTTSTFEYYNGQPIIRIKAPFPTQFVTLDPMNAISTWTAVGDASGLTVDTAVYYQSPASLRFNMASGDGSLVNNLSSSTNISSLQGVGVAFLALYIPQDVSFLTSITLKVGSTEDDYDAVTITNPFIGSFTSNLWQLVAFDFANADTNGTPDWSAIQYLELEFVTSGAIVNIRVGDLFISQPTPAQILFQSAAIFLPSGSTTPLTTITSNTDTIILTNPAYNLFLYEGAMHILENTSGGLGDAMYERLNRKLNDKELGLYALFRGDNPSQELRQTESWYDPSIGGWMGYGNANGSW